MFPTVTSGRAFSWTYRGLLVDYRLRFEFRHRLTELAAAVSFLLLAMIFFAATAKAVEATGRDDSLSALRDYVQLIDSGAKPARSPDQDFKNVDQNQTVDAAYAALRAFAERIGVDEPAPTADLPKLAEADNLLDFLRGLNSPAQPSAAPKGAGNGQRSGRGGNASQPLPCDATYVGAKVCSTCHASQAESFSRTLMGKIGKTQKGKFDCENCHGPGSAHVKAGGGRGVGGIISFRPDDLSRTAEENNAFASAATRKAIGQTGTAVRTMSAASCAAIATRS